jgi:hypothetical protein
MNPAHHTDASAHRHSHERPGSTRRRRRSSPARSLLGAGLFARLGLAAGALVLLWTTVLWAVR